MKLLYCPVCDDVVRLIDVEWRICMCHRSGGQYTPDSLTAFVGGRGKIFGIPNPFFDEGYMSPPGDIAKLRDKYQQWTTDVWWGEYKGDWQLMRVNNPLGPVPSNWEKRLNKLKLVGGVKGYEGRTEIEKALREKWRGNALLRAKAYDLGRSIWSRWRRKTKDEIIEYLSNEIKDQKKSYELIIQNYESKLGDCYAASEKH